MYDLNIHYANTCHLKMYCINMCYSNMYPVDMYHSRRPTQPAQGVQGSEFRVSITSDTIIPIFALPQIVGSETEGIGAGTDISGCQVSRF